MEGYQWGGQEGRMGEKIQEIRSINGRYKIDRGGKNSIGNGEVKELTGIYMTHGHETKVWGNAGGVGYYVEGDKGEKRDNYSSIINKIHFQKSNTNWQLQNSHRNVN